MCSASLSYTRIALVFCSFANLKGHRAGLDTSFVTFEKRLPQPEIKVTRRRQLQNPLQSCFVVLLIVDLLLKTCS